MIEQSNYSTFTRYVESKENDVFQQPHEVKAEMKIPAGIERLAEAFKKSKDVPIGKEVDKDAGGEKNVTLKKKALYIVGGAVRDFMLGHTPSNYNLCTDAHPEEVVKILQNARPAIRVIKADTKAGVIKVQVDGDEYEIHTMKKKGTEEDIFTASPAEDSEQRDCTINALYYDVLSKKIIDHHGGIRHIKDGVVKPIGKASDMLKKNGTHKYRMARMANQLPNGRIDDEAKEAIHHMSADDDDVPPEKVREEFLKGLENAHTNVKRYLKTYQELGLLEKVFPKLELSQEFPDCSTCKSRAIVLASLLKNNKPSKLVPALKDLRYSDREIKDAVFLINLLWFLPDHIYEFKKEVLNTSLTKRQILDWAKSQKLDKDVIEKLVDYKLQVNGNDLIEKEGLQGDALRDRVKKMEAAYFKKSLRA